MSNEKNYWGCDIVEEILNPNINTIESEDLNEAFNNWSKIETDKPQIELYYQFMLSTQKIENEIDWSIIELNT
ncbi:MAG: hypothetical protein ACOYMA_19335 [Bacteroidia bacterium]